MAVQGSGRFSLLIERQSFVAPRARLVYVPTPKVACTTLKRAVVELEDAWTGVASSGPEPTEQQSIHDPSLYSLRPLGDLPDDRRSEVLTSEAWIRFCVTRNPYERVVSGWANKVLLGYLGGPIDEQFAAAGVPGPGSGCRVDLGVVFRSFLRQLPTNRRQFGDDHLAPQTTLLDPDRFPYTHIVDLAQLDCSVAEIRASHPDRAGFVLGPRGNEGLRLCADELFDAETAAIVDDLYAADFERFGYRRRSFPATASPVWSTPNEVALMAMVRDRNDRITAVSEVARSRTSGRYALATLAQALRARATLLRPARSG